MSHNMVLELEGDQPDWQACRLAAQLAGVSEMSNQNERFSGRFAFSEMHFSAFERTWPGPICAAGRHGCRFPVRDRVIFRVAAEAREECMKDIHSFLLRLTQLSPMRFVLSRQGEEVHALRDEGRGFRFYWPGSL